jgi:tetratricopeptide (TPR) repeat protein
LLGESAERLAHRETESLEAYTAFLLGVDDFSENSFDSLSKAETHFGEAVRLDPNYALAWARLGDTYLQMENTGAGSFDDMIENARDAASKALEIDANLASAIAVLGNAERRLGNRELSEQLLVRAIEVGPNDITAKLYYSRLLWGQLRVQESMAIIDELLVLDPLSAEAHFQRTVALSLLGDYEGGIAQARRMVEINPNSPTGYYREAEMEFRLGNWANAVIKAMEAQEIDASDPELPMMIADYYLAMELPNDAERWYDRATEIDASHPVSRAAPLVVYLYNNDIANAAKLARQLLDEGVGDRQGSQELMLRAIWKEAEESGRYREALDYLRDHFPRLFEDDPQWRFDDRFFRVAIGSMLMAAGDEKHGRPLLSETLDRADKAAVEFGPWLLGVRASNGLGDESGALQRFRAFVDEPYSPDLWPIKVRGASDLELLKDEPEYLEWVSGLQENAARQRELLSELLAAD